jgi:hypothetical protein
MGGLRGLHPNSIEFPSLAMKTGFQIGQLRKCKAYDPDITPQSRVDMFDVFDLKTAKLFLVRAPS